MWVHPKRAAMTIASSLMGGCGLSHKCVEGIMEATEWTFPFIPHHGQGLKQTKARTLIT